MNKSLRDKHSCIKPCTIKVLNSTCIVKKLLLIIKVDPNISNEALDIILDDKFRIKPYSIQI